MALRQPLPGSEGAERDPDGRPLDLLCVLDAEGKLVSAGPRWLDELGWKDRELEHRPFTELLAGPAQLSFTQAMRGLGPRAETAAFAGAVTDADGRERACRWRLALREDGAVVAQGELERPHFAKESSAVPEAGLPASSEPVTELLQQLRGLIRDQNEEWQQIAKERRRLARALEESRRRERDSEVLRDALEYLQSCTTLAEGLEVLGRQSARLFDAPVQVYAFDSEAELFSPIGEAANATPTIPVGECWGCRTGRPHLSQNGSLALGCRHEKLGDGEELLCLPLLCEAELFGLLRVGPAARGAILRGGPAALRGQMLEFGVIARQFALALRNVRLRESLHRQASEDALTGLANRRAFELCLGRELARWRRHHEPFSLLMLDVDRFKELNDRQGHSQGDQFLGSLASGWRRMVRTEDCLARIGGDEFALLMVRAGKGDALEKAEALRAVARRWEGRDRQTCTVSVGVAEVGADGHDRDSLLRAADQALYRAKESGRNRVMAAATPPESETARA